jgi:hypothetical protein
VTMQKFNGWTGTEEFNAWEDDLAKREADTVRTRTILYAREHGKPMRIPVWLVVAFGSCAGLGFVWLLIHFVVAVGVWINGL